MAIRIREIEGEAVALCAAETKQKNGDIYLNDAAHHALLTKFLVDFESEGLIIDPPVDDMVKKIMLAEESS